MFSRNVKAAIQAAREERGLTIDALAAEVGVSPRLVQKWQQGRAEPVYANRLKLAAALGHGLAWFYTDHDDEPVAA